MTEVLKVVNKFKKNSSKYSKNALILMERNEFDRFRIVLRTVYELLLITLRFFKLNLPKNFIKQLRMHFQ